jgi:GNAT superfamily N-acetyltransferase
VSAPLKDNLHLADVEVGVPVAQRRRGVGSLLLTEVEAWAAALGRTSLLSQTYAPPGQPCPGQLFAVASGYVVAHREGFKVLDLTEHASGWTALDEQVAKRAGDYRIVEWGDHTPDDLVEDLCAALSRFMGMIPLGDLDLEDADVTPERLRANEEHQVSVGYRGFCSAAVDGSGALVGYSDLRVTLARTTQAAVGVTMVLPEHRGHRLGLALKLATHRALLREFPECEVVRTGNADVNEHMNVVNALMGYRLVEDIVELQKRL